jgi:signal transduction histidine kinase
VTAVLVGLGAYREGTGVLSAVSVTLVLTFLPAVAGQAARNRRDYLDQVTERLAEVERQRDEQARQAVQAERARIARELHDVVAHHVSLIGVQAGAARTGTGPASPQIVRALESIEAGSRAAVEEMRHLLDALRPLAADPENSAVSGAQPLSEAVDRMRAAGYEVELETLGDLSALSPGRALSVQRVVEEALTNVAKHSSARRVTVLVQVRPPRVHLEVHDPGPARPSRDGDDSRSTGGRGLLGMRERMALYGGTVQAAPAPGGGFTVVGDLP